MCFPIRVLIVFLSFNRKAEDILSGSTDGFSAASIPAWTSPLPPIPVDQERPALLPDVVPLSPGDVDEGYESCVASANSDVAPSAGAGVASDSPDALAMQVIIGSYRRYKGRGAR